MKRESNYELFCKFIDEKNILQDYAKNYFDEEHICEDTTFEYLTEVLDDADAFAEEVYYYSSAMELLSREDASLRRSMLLAAALGYHPDSLTSTVLATLLSEAINREEWDRCEVEIQVFLDNLEWDDEEETDYRVEGDR